MFRYNIDTLNIIESRISQPLTQSYRATLLFDWFSLVAKKCPIQQCYMHYVLRVKNTCTNRHSSGVSLKRYWRLLPCILLYILHMPVFYLLLCACGGGGIGHKTVHSCTTTVGCVCVMVVMVIRCSFGLVGSFFLFISQTFAIRIAVLYWIYSFRYVEMPPEVLFCFFLQTRNERIKRM